MAADDAEDYRRPIAIGVSDHNGWAEFVTIGVEVGEPVIVDRRHAELINSLPAQPYHHETMDMADEAAEALVSQVKSQATELAKNALNELLADVDQDTWRPEILTLREPPLPALPDTVAEVHANQLALHAADGMIYHDALCEAASAAGLSIVEFHMNDVLTICCDRLDCSADELEEILLQFGREVGSPWQKEHRIAAAAAIDALFNT